jgi:hypothetical protein
LTKNIPKRTTHVASKRLHSHRKRMEDAVRLPNRTLTRRVQIGFQRTRSFRKEERNPFSKSRENIFFHKYPIKVFLGTDKPLGKGKINRAPICLRVRSWRLFQKLLPSQIIAIAPKFHRLIFPFSMPGHFSLGGSFLRPNSRLSLKYPHRERGCAPICRMVGKTNPVDEGKP